MQSFERLKGVYSKGLRTLRIIGRVRSSQIALKENSLHGVTMECAQDSLSGPMVSSNILSDDKIARDSNYDQIFNEQTSSDNSLQSTLEWYKWSFNNRP